VQVDRQAGDARHRQVERRHVRAQPAEVRQQPPADAAVDVQRQAPLERSCPNASTGSTTPCAYDAALATSSTVRSVTAARVASTSARKVTGSTSTSTASSAR
jgi:hypothetical protein